MYHTSVDDGIGNDWWWFLAIHVSCARPGLRCMHVCVCLYKDQDAAKESNHDTWGEVGDGAASFPDAPHRLPPPLLFRDNPPIDPPLPCSWKHSNPCLVPILPHPTTLPLIAHYTNLLQDSPSPDCLAPESPLTNLAFQDIYPASQRACSKPICSLKTLKTPPASRFKTRENSGKVSFLCEN